MFQVLYMRACVRASMAKHFVRKLPRRRWITYPKVSRLMENCLLKLYFYRASPTTFVLYVYRAMYSCIYTNDKCSKNKYFLLTLFIIFIHSLTSLLGYYITIQYIPVSNQIVVSELVLFPNFLVMIYINHSDASFCHISVKSASTTKSFSQA